MKKVINGYSFTVKSPSYYVSDVITSVVLFLDITNNKWAIHDGKHTKIIGNKDTAFKFVTDIFDQAFYGAIK